MIAVWGRWPLIIKSIWMDGEKRPGQNQRFRSRTPFDVNVMRNSKVIGQVCKQLSCRLALGPCKKHGTNGKEKPHPTERVRERELRPHSLFSYSQPNFKKIN